MTRIYIIMLYFGINGCIALEMMVELEWKLGSIVPTIPYGILLQLSKWKWEPMQYTSTGINTIQSASFAVTMSIKVVDSAAQ